jgi:spore germination protein KC
MRIRMVVCITLLLLSLTLVGCWDRKELDTLGFVIAVGIDKSEKKEESFRLTSQVVNPGEVAKGGGSGGGAGKTPVTTFSETGATVFEAIRKSTKTAPRKLYWGHNQVLVIGEDMARRGIADLFDLFERDHEIRTDFYVLVVKNGKASDVLQIMTSLEKIPGNKIHSQVEANEGAFGTSYGVPALDFIKSLSSEGRQPVAASIKIVGDKEAGNGKENVEKIEPPSKLVLDSMAAFKEGKLVGFLTPNESRGLAWTQDKIKNTVVNVSCKKKGYIVMEIIRSSTEMKAEMKKGRPQMLIKVKQEANVAEVACTEVDVSKKETIPQLEKGTEDHVKQEIEDVVKKVQQELKTDIFGFGELVYKADPAYWEQHKEDWDELFVNVPVKVEVDTQIRREGMRTKSYLQKVEKGENKCWR